MKWRLKRLLELPENWDSYGASSIRRSCVVVADHILDKFEADLVAGLNDGGVTIETKLCDIEIRPRKRCAEEDKADGC